ncbi:hypothetical protein FRC14_007910 [Serendipita sp. 396]|nr:hypothetical protein FRC14_007910 [Serendipita sp. 396]KAG8780747.1 hypothetical protein FRC15_009289 [Serendipita sp. 397]KAG8802621.1 hypothetical protein FRC16_009142 [Serendipita sp. 398]KAG8862201.1 hypothetical protein FRC20_011311 [Serendipita sp. 405]
MPKAEDFAPADPKGIAEVCHASENEVLEMATFFETHDGQLPDERALSSLLRWKLGTKAGKIIWHSQAMEGQSGTDFMIQMTLTKEFTEELVEKLDKVKLGEKDAPAPGPSKVKTRPATPKVDTQPSTPMDGASDLRGKTHLQTPGGVLTSPRKTRSKTNLKIKGGGHTPVEGAPPLGAATSKSKQIIIILQAKSYHKTGQVDEKGPKRSAGFTYKGDKSEKLQLLLLQDYAKKVREQNPSAAVIEGYIVFSGKGNADHEYGKGVAWIPLQTIIDRCKHHNKGNDCTKSDKALDKALSDEFMDEEVKKKENSASECWLQDALKDYY